MALNVQSWKKTALGTPIALFASDDLARLKEQQPLLLMGGIHGDEPEGVRLAQDTLNWLLQWPTQTPNKALLPWIVIPCLNVDGFACHTRVNGRKVDLNRNYPSKDWAPSFEKERYFPGPTPASEPEIQAVVELIHEMQPRIIIHCHSWKPCIVGSGAPSKNDAKRLGKSSGYEVINEIGYPTPGSLSSFGWHDLKIPVICIEEKDETPPDQMNRIWPRFEKAMIEIFTDLSPREGPAHKGTVE